MEIVPLGDSALIVRVREQFEDAPDETLNEVLRTFQSLQGRGDSRCHRTRAGLHQRRRFLRSYRRSSVECRSERRSDELATRFGARLLAAYRGVIAAGPQPVSRLIEIPVCYDPEFALDLDRVAEQRSCSEREIVDLHSRTRVSRGLHWIRSWFPFLAGFPKKLATPRRRRRERKFLPVR